MFDDQALEAVARYWRVSDDVERARRPLESVEAKRRALEAAPRIDPETLAWHRTCLALAESVTELGETTPTTPRGAIEMLTVALEELTPAFSVRGAPQGAVSPMVRDVDKLAIIRRVRDALEGWG
jgi:hypothetical protein